MHSHCQQPCIKHTVARASPRSEKETGYEAMVVKAAVLHGVNKYVDREESYKVKR